MPRHDEENQDRPGAAGGAAVEVGGEYGALVVHASADLAGEEVQLAGPGGFRTHTLIRERRPPGGSEYVGLFGSLLAGRYRLCAHTYRAHAVVRPGRVSSVRLIDRARA